MAKQPFKITQTTVEAAVCPEGKKDFLLFDSVTRGFGLRVSKGGVKTFLAQFRAATGVRRVVIGTFGVLAAEEARRKAKVILGAAADGRDIAAERKAAEAAAVEEAEANAFTFGAMIEQWAEARKTDNRPSYLAEAVKCCTRNLPGWQKRPARSISTSEAAKELHAIKASKGTTTANRTLAYARAAYSWACDNHKVKANPLKGIKRPGKEAPRERVLTEAELKVVWQGAGALSSVSGGFIRALMLTLQRREEVGSMQWGELADDLSAWTLPGIRAKNGRTTIVHLSEPVQAVIRALPRIEGNPYVFVGRKDGEPIRGFNSAKANLDKVMAAAGAAIPAWSFHDFRRSGVTTLAKAGFAPHVCDRILNHITGSIQGVAAVYQRHEFLLERAEALNAWAALIADSGALRAADPSSDRNVA
jgi:integrase